MTEHSSLKILTMRAKYDVKNDDQHNLWRHHPPRCDATVDTMRLVHPQCAVPTSDSQLPPESDVIKVDSSWHWRPRKLPMPSNSSRFQRVRPADLMAYARNTSWTWCRLAQAWRDSGLSRSWPSSPTSMRLDDDIPLSVIPVFRASLWPWQSFQQFGHFTLR